MLLGDALAFVAGEVCIRVAGVIRDGTQTVRISPGRIEAGSHTLWLAKGAKLFTLTKHEGQTLVYCHDNQTGYYGAPGATLCSECPDDHAFLVQAVEDQPDDWTKGMERRLLVMDLVAWPHGPLEPCPRRRREYLWSNARWFSQQSRVQWGGDRDALERFLSAGLPHEVSCILAIKAPLVFVKEVTLTLPTASAFPPITKLPGPAALPAHHQAAKNQA